MPESVALAAQGAQASNFFSAFTGTQVPASTVGPAFINTSGLNGAIMFELIENNIAGSGQITLEGSFQNTAGLTGSSALWYPLGYYTIVSNGTTSDTLTRAHAAITLTQNGRYVLQVLDAYPYMRARVNSNGSSASLTVNVYSMAA